MGLWLPSEISPHTWIDFSDTATLFDAVSGGSVVTNGVGIARAEDKSGNGHHFTEATSGNRFTWTSVAQNSLGVARSDGNDRLTSTAAASLWNFLHSGDSSIFIVNKSGTSSNPGAAYGWIGNNGSSSANRGVSFSYDDRALTTGMTDCFNCLCSDTGGVIAYASTVSGTNAIVTDFRDIITPNAFGLFTINSDPSNATASNRIELSVNGGSLVGNNARTGTNSSNNATFALQIGAVGNNAGSFLGDFCEIVIFDSILSTENQQLMQGSLAWKWGLESLLPIDHPYKNAAPRTGIARPKINGSLLNRGLINGSLIQ
jgi:hypothetical protein